MTKKEFRKAAIKKRNEIGNREEQSRKIHEKIVQHPFVKEAETVFLYLSCRSEVETCTLLEALRQMGKQLAVPRVEGEQMVFCRIASIEDTEAGSFQILEPRLTCPMITPQKKDVILVPGVAFDKRGYRLGYGGGYYDRFLSMYPKMKTIGLAFLEQIYDEIPIEIYDRCLDDVITP